MEIQISGDYYLRSDKLNLILSQKKMVLDGKNKGQYYFDDLGFYRTLPGVLEGCLKRRINLSEATTFVDLAEDYREAMESVRAFCNIFENQVKELQRKGV